MIDAVTRERVLIHAQGKGSPYFMVPEEQLSAVTTALQDHDVPFWIDEDTISIDGEPAIAFVNLSRGADVAAVQQFLDEI